MVSILAEVKVISRLPKNSVSCRYPFSFSSFLGKTTMDTTFEWWKCSYALMSNPYQPLGKVLAIASRCKCVIFKLQFLVWWRLAFGPLVMWSFVRRAAGIGTFVWSTGKLAGEATLTILLLFWIVVLDSGWKFTGLQRVRISFGYFLTTVVCRKMFQLYIKHASIHPTRIKHSERLHCFLYESTGTNRY